ncbi:MAG: hypothetical protein JO022_19505 [Acidobacteriaceae bacterium]|nr:hypothetical protein [Acidobacteriaceae bacterium]
MRQELSKLAFDYCLEARIESFVLPVGVDDLKVAFGTDVQLKRMFDDRRLTAYSGKD